MEGLNICHVDHDLKVHVSWVSFHDDSASHVQGDGPHGVAGVEVGPSRGEGLSEVAWLGLGSWVKASTIVGRLTGGVSLVDIDSWSITIVSRLY